MEILKILLKKLSLCAPWETSLIKLSIVLNGEETFSAKCILILLMTFQIISRILKFLLLNLNRILLSLESDLLWKKLKSSLIWKNQLTSQCALSKLVSISKICIITKFRTSSVSSLMMLRTKMDILSGLVLRELQLQLLLTLKILYMLILL